jgi:type II secretion system (T2SS) protein E
MQRQTPSRDVIRTTVKHRLGQLLVEAGIVDEARLRTALLYQRRSGCRLGQALIHLKLANEAHVVQALSRQLKCAHVDLAGLQVGPALARALKLVPPEFALRKKILPVGASENTLTLAMADPCDAALVRDLSLMTGRRVNVGIAGEGEIVAAIRHLYSFTHASSPSTNLSRAAAYSITPEHVPLLLSPAPDWFASPVDGER